MSKKDIGLALIIILGAWYLLAVIISQPILPFPHEVGTAFLEELVRGDLLVHFLASFLRVITSTILAIIIASPLGLLLGQSNLLNKIFAPIIYILYPIPKIVLVPVFLLLLGVGNIAKISIIFVVLFFQILVLVRDQALTLRPELIQSVRSLGAGRRALFRYVYLPASLPGIITALRQSIGTSVAILYVTELFATQKGLGYYIYLNGSTLFKFPAMYAGIVAMGILGLGLYIAIDQFEKYLCPWLNVQ